MINKIFLPIIFAVILVTLTIGAFPKFRTDRLQGGRVLQEDNKNDPLLSTNSAGPYIGGDKLSTLIDQSSSSAIQPFLSEDGTSMWYEISFRPGASYTTVHFEDFDLEPHCRMIVSGKDLPNGRIQQYEMTGKGKMGLQTFWTQHVKGDTMYIQVICDVQPSDETENVSSIISNNKKSVMESAYFVVDEVAVGFVQEDNDQDANDVGIFQADQAESVCGVADFQNVICYQDTTMYTKSRAVARLLINGNSWCTGWLVANNNYLLTNEHCINNQRAASNTDFDFGAEAPTCDFGNCKACYSGDIFSGAAFVQGNCNLDYALVLIPHGDPGAKYGYLDLDNRQGQVNEQIYIPQHPSTRAKEFGYRSTHAFDSPDGLCHLQSITERNCNGKCFINDYGYYCDTEGGSSGSPVVAASTDKVIALHHCGAACSQSGGSLNRGVPIHLIYADLGCRLYGTCSMVENMKHSLRNGVRNFAQELSSFLP